MKWIAPATLALVVGCTPVSPPRGPEAEARDSFRFVGGGGATTARIVEPDLLWSSQGRVQTFEDGHRGVWGDEIVDLRTHGNVIEGFIGSFRTELHITPVRDGFRLDGLYRGGLGELHVTSRYIIGNVGAGYVGVVREDGARQYASQNAGVGGATRTLRLPETFASLPIERQALYLALVIGV